MNLNKAILPALLLVVLGTLPVRAEDGSNLLQLPPNNDQVRLRHISLELIADNGIASSSQKIGVKFSLEPGWHIYGQTAGDVGLPTSVTWNLPPGIKANEPIWPKPRTFIADGLTSYGYENELSLISELVADESSDTDSVAIGSRHFGSSIDVKAAVEWVLCKEECIPGRATLNKTITLLSTLKQGGKSGIPATFAADSSPGLLLSIWLAFIGGILLNLMPCVFPVLSLKILSFVDQNDSRKALHHGGAFAFGIVLSFWILSGMLLLIRAVGSEAGWGFQFQSPTFVVLMGFLLFAIGLNLMGVYEIGFGLQRAASKADRQNGCWGSFFGGVLSTLLATPCSAPFMASAVAAALVMPVWMAFLVFTSIGLGMSAPYLLLSAFPHLLRFLPKSGSWMVRLKQGLSFPMFATVIWLVWILSLQVGSDGVVRFLLGLLFISIGLWTFGQWCLATVRLRYRIMALSVMGLSLIAAFSVVLPLEPTVSGVQIGGKGKGEIATEPYSERRLNELLASNRPVLVEFSAAWCLTCQVNDLIVYRSEQVQKRLQEKGVVLLVGDWTKRDSAITRAINSLGRDGVPLNALYIPSRHAPLVLPQVLTPDGLLAALGEIPT